MKPRCSFNLKIVGSGFLSMNFRYDQGYDDVYDLVVSAVSLVPNHYVSISILSSIRGLCGLLLHRSVGFAKYRIRHHSVSNVG